MNNRLTDKVSNLLSSIKKMREVNFRELVWPLLDPLENNIEIRGATDLLEESKNTWNDTDIQFLIYHIEKYRDSEDDRLKTVESKSIVFIGLFGISIIILTNLANNIALQLRENVNLTEALLFILVTAIIIYLCRSVWFAVKALERQEYYKIGIPKYILTNIDENKIKFLIELYNSIKKNQMTINLKVDYMTMSQEYFKRAIVVVFVFTGVYFVYTAIYLLSRLP